MDKQKNRPPSNLHRNGHCGVFHPRVAIGDYRLFDPNDPGLPSFLPLLPPPSPPSIDSHRLKTAQVEIRFQEKHLQNNKECFLLFLFVFFSLSQVCPPPLPPLKTVIVFRGFLFPETGRWLWIQPIWIDQIVVAQTIKTYLHNKDCLNYFYCCYHFRGFLLPETGRWRPLV